MMVQPFLSYIAIISLLNSFTAINANPFYCENGVTQTISNETTGLIKTRQTEDGFSGDNLRCSWVIEAGAGHKVHLSILNVDLQWSPTYTTCNDYDYLKILEGDEASGIHIASVCHARSPHNVISKGSALYLVYTTTQQDFAKHRGIELRFTIFANDSCPPNWFQAADNPDECFMIGSLGKEKWVDSQDKCHYSNANLASITSEKDFNAISDNGNSAGMEKAWIGLSELQSEGTFKWVDKRPVQYERTRVGYGYRTHCIAQNFKSGNWEALNCDENLLNYVCKAKRDGSTVLYPAIPPSEPPAEGDEGTKLYIVVIVIVVLILIIGVSVLVFLLYLRKNKRCKNKNNAPQSRSAQSPLQCGDNELNDLGATSPSSQQVAPPTYEESKTHAVLHL